MNPGRNHIPIMPSNVRFGSKADMCSATRHVRFTPNSDCKSRHRLVGPMLSRAGQEADDHDIFVMFTVSSAMRRYALSNCLASTVISTFLVLIGIRQSGNRGAVASSG